jgi:hypothetical protein
MVLHGAVLAQIGGAERAREGFGDAVADGIGMADALVLADLDFGPRARRRELAGMRRAPQGLGVAQHRSCNNRGPPYRAASITADP